MYINFRAYMDLALAMFIAGSAVVVSKMMVESLPTFLATELGLFIGLLILLPVTFCVKKEVRQLDIKTHVVLFLQAICGIFLYRVFTFWGLVFTSAADSGLITSAGPVIVVLLAGLILKEKIMCNQIIGIVCVVIGLMIINLYTYYLAAGSEGSLIGNMLILVAVVCEALFSILSKINCKPMSAIYRTTIIALYAFICLLPFAIYDAKYYDFHEMQYSSMLCVLYYGVFVSFLSYILWFRGIEKVPVNNAAVFTSVVPVSSILLSALLLKEAILISHIVGLVCIIAGIWISCYPK